MLSRPDILDQHKKKNIFIQPFDLESVGTNSYDVRLGGWIFQKELAQPARKVLHPWFELGDLEGIKPDDLVVVIRPGESILAHTHEFIGSNCSFITTRMAARSTIGRSGLEITRCAGVGDVGYCNRWTLEITNNLQYHMIPLVVGRRIGQVLFDGVTPLDEGDEDYTQSGKYQQTADLEEMVRMWNPDMMLPRAYLDREVARNDSV
jgi:dCTP deaminase